MMTLTLTWQQENPDVWVAWSDQLRVGHVVKRIDGVIWFDATIAVHMRHIARKPYYGETKNFDTGKRAVEKAWATWCKMAGLTRAA